ncbi:hypothetical protein [Priestia endophytica]|uniref:hypothetical protein n=1 Tax=Priestia endophytica TaxID=135735 RepID=UPI00203A70C9|nr:hypothetical protein [Priestia endophytica]MCM3538327.1 hypothetical protein [Priestia endophytica]
MEKAKEGRVLTKERIIVVLVLVVILALIPDLLVARYWGRKDREVYQGHKETTRAANFQTNTNN